MTIWKYFYSKKSLKRKILAIKDDLTDLAKKHCTEKFFIEWYGAYQIDPKHLVFWICIQSDKMKHELESNIDLNKDLRNLLAKNEYPVEAQKFVYISFESQETVDRESNGDWHIHFQ
jgi:hypothetical protein